jgi:Glutaredoxin-like domain (DUF836)
MRLILFSKPGCHLCEGLQEKLEQIQQRGTLNFRLDLCDITTRPEWFQAYQYEIPVLFVESQAAAAGGDSEEDSSTSKPTLVPRPSPRISVAQLEQTLQKYLPIDPSK